MGSCAKPKSKKPLAQSSTQSSGSVGGRGDGGGRSGRSHVFLNTNGVCFLCFEDCTTDVPDDVRQQNLQTSINFCRLTSRYLGFNLGKLVDGPLRKAGRNCKSRYKNVEENDTTPRDRVGVELCGGCLTLAESFCKLHFQVEYHQMILDRCVRSISEVITEANKKTKKALFTIADDEEAMNKQQKTFTRLTLGGFRSAQSVRNKLYQMSVEKLSRSFPTICLRRICKSGEWISLLNGKNKVKETSKGTKLISSITPEEVVASMMGCIVSLWIVLSLSFINPEELINKVKVDRLVGMQQKLLSQQHSIIQFVEAQGQIPVEVLNVPIITSKKEICKAPSPGRPGRKRRGRPPGFSVSGSIATTTKKEVSKRPRSEKPKDGVQRVCLRNSTLKTVDEKQPPTPDNLQSRNDLKGEAFPQKSSSPKDVQRRTDNAQKELNQDKNSEVLTWKSKSSKYPTSLEPIPSQIQSTSMSLEAPVSCYSSSVTKLGVSLPCQGTANQLQSAPKSSYQPPSQHFPPQPQPSYVQSGVIPPHPSSYAMPPPAPHSYYSQQPTSEAHSSSHVHSSTAYPSTSPMMHSQSYDPNYYYNNAPPPPLSADSAPTGPSQYNYGYNYPTYNYSTQPQPVPTPNNSWQTYDNSVSSSVAPYSSEPSYSYTNLNDSYYGAYYNQPSTQVGTSGAKQDYNNYDNYPPHPSQNYYYAQSTFTPPIKNPGEQNNPGELNSSCPSASTPSPPLTHEEPKNTDSAEEMDLGQDDDDGVKNVSGSPARRSSSDFQPLSIFPEVHWRQQQDMPKLPCTFSGCNEQFVRTDHLDLHLRSHGSFQCSFCQMSFGKGHSLALHEKGKHTRPSSSGNKTKCSRCDFNSASQNNFFIHFLSDHLNIQLYDQSCEICKKKFVAGARKYVKRNHFKNYHDIEGKNPNSIFRCRLCNAPFLKESQLKDHDSYCEGPMGREVDREEESDVYDEMPSRAASVVSSIDTSISFDIAHATASAITFA